MKNYHNTRCYQAPFFILPLVLVLVMVLSSCGSSAQPAIHIIEPTDVSAGDVAITVDVSQFELGDRGHIIYYLDASVPTYYDHSAVSKAGTYTVSNDTTHVWRNLTPGAHKFSVQLVDDNNSPLPVPVVDTLTIEIGPPAGSPTVTISNPVDGDTLPPGIIMISVDVQGIIVSGADMGVINRNGEGHFIYYIDETPPVDSGVPATTDTSIVTTSLHHLWKGVPEGQHTFSVQLVNNDDTPLDTPVTATITIDVAAG